jgi:hypothetical protein
MMVLNESHQPKPGVCFPVKRLFANLSAAFGVALLLTACVTHRGKNVEVAPAVFWVISDDSGRHESLTRYKPLVVAQGVPFKLNFSEQDSFDSPDTGKREVCFNGVRARLSVTISNTTACFLGRSEYQTHLGVTSSSYEDDKTLYGQTIRTYSARFDGTARLGKEIRVHAGEDINNGPFLCLVFRETSAPVAKFKGEPQEPLTTGVNKNQFSRPSWKR